MTTSTRFAFTKVLVDDLSAQSSFYCSAFGLTQKTRLTVGVGNDALEEVILTTGRSDDGSLVLLRYLERDTPPTGELVLGFNVADVRATVQRVAELGGSVVKAPTEMAELGVIVAFATDPDGHLIEIVQNL